VKGKVDKRIGNEFWKLRNRCGRKKIFERPEMIIEAANEYISNSNPVYTLREFADRNNFTRSTLNSMVGEHKVAAFRVKDMFFDLNHKAYLRGEINRNAIAKTAFDRGIELPKSQIREGYIVKTRKTRPVIKQGAGFCYLIKLMGLADSIYKIGFSTNPKRRLRDISGGLPFNIKVIKCKQDLFAFELEQSLHEMFENKRVKGEWYKLDKSDVLLATGHMK